MAIEKSLVSGSMTMLILKLLSEKDMYGYEMIDTLRQKSSSLSGQAVILSGLSGSFLFVYCQKSFILQTVQ